jgi:hypothetical protein
MSMLSLNRGMALLSFLADATPRAGAVKGAELRADRAFRGRPEVGLHDTDRHRLANEVEKELGVTYHADVAEMGAV